MCKTKPIGPQMDGNGRTAARPGSPAGVDRAKRCQFGRASGGDAQPTKSRSCETKPNLGGLRHVGKGGPRKWSGFAGRWNVRNKPNLPEPVRVTSAFERKGYGNFRRLVGREKQSQFRPTGPCESRSLGGSRARTPNPRRVGGAKQTQFPVAGMPHHSTIPPFQHSNPMPIVRNKANSWGQTASKDRAFGAVCQPHPPSGCVRFFSGATQFLCLQ